MAAYSPRMSLGGAVVGFAATQVPDRMDPTWPPVLVAVVLALLIGAIVVVTTMFRRFRAAARGDRYGSSRRR
jgi:sensor histidine kinase regulating citrate/malate metabolism